MSADFAKTATSLTRTLIEKLEDAFGREISVDDQIEKLYEEVDEYHEHYDWEELADVVIVCCTIAEVSGLGVAELLDRVLRKMEINAKRSWSAKGNLARHIDEGAA